MNRLTNPLRLTFALLVITLLVACAPGEELPSPEEIQAAINTAVAQTMEAEEQIADSVAMTVAVQNTQTAVAIPTQTNTLAQTDTPVVAATFEPAIIITDTPLASNTPVTPSPTFPPPPTDPPAATVEVPLYACDVDNAAPKDSEEVKPGENFKIKWMIVNTGTKALPAGVDVKYAGGSQMTTVTRVEIPNALQPGESYTLVLNAVAPKEQGLQYMTWVVEGPLCYAYVAINVK